EGGALRAWRFDGVTFAEVKLDQPSPPVLGFTAARDGRYQIGAFFTRSLEAVDVDALFPEKEIAAGGKARLDLGAAGHGYSLELDRAGNGSIEEVPPEWVKVRPRNAPVILTGKLTQGSGGRIEQKI